MERPLILPTDALRSFAESLGVEWCVVAAVGPAAQGLVPADGPVELGGIWVAPTADLLRVLPPEPRWRREGYVAERDTVLDALELGEAMRRLVRGDSEVLDALLSHRNVVSSELHEHLLERARDGLFRGHVEDYLRRARAWRGRAEPWAAHAAAALLLQADHLQRTGQVGTDAGELARATGRPELLRAPPAAAELDALEDAVRRGAALGVLPRQHPRPEALDELLLFAREARW